MFSLPVGGGGERIKKPAVVVLGYKSTINNQGQTGRATLCIQIDFFKLVQVVPKLIDMDLSPAICSFQFPVPGLQVAGCSSRFVWFAVLRLCGLLPV